MKKTELNALVEKVDNIEQLVNDLNNAIDEDDIKQALEAHGLDVSLEEMAALACENEELTEEELFDVVGGCKCPGILKRVLISLFCWVGTRATGRKITCPDCGY